MTKRLRKTEGFTLIELIVGLAIFMIGIVSVVQAYQLGLLQMGTLKLRNQATECARLTMEYLMTIPGDVAFQMAAGGQSSAMAYNQSYSSNDLNTYVTSSNPSCSEMSANANIALRYQLCNGCASFLTADALAADPTGEGTRCEYDIALRVFWRDQMLGHRMHAVYYKTKQYTNRMSLCTAAGACGLGTNPERVTHCTFSPLPN